MALGLLPAGAYELTIDGVGDTTGTYAFQLLNLTNAAELEPGQPVSGTLPTRGTAAYRFAATAGDRLFFDMQALSGYYYTPNWRLLNPYGVEVFNRSLADVDVQTLSQTGTYTLLLEAYIQDPNGTTPSYTVNVQPVQMAAPIPLTGIGGPQGPDLTVTNLTVTPNTGVQSGSTVTVSWNDSNTGTQATTGSWNDRIVVRNVATNTILFVATIPYDATVEGALSAGVTRARQAVVTLPAGL